MDSPLTIFYKSRIRTDLQSITIHINKIYEINSTPLDALNRINEIRKILPDLTRALMWVTNTRGSNNGPFV